MCWRTNRRFSVLRTKGLHCARPARRLHHKQLQTQTDMDGKASGRELSDAVGDEIQSDRWHAVGASHTSQWDGVWNKLTDTKGVGAHVIAAVMFALLAFVSFGLIRPDMTNATAADGSPTTRVSWAKVALAVAVSTCGFAAFELWINGVPVHW